jgi:hypothetical protein
LTENAHFGGLSLVSQTIYSLTRIYDAFDWREKDAVKNSITMAASAYFSHKQLQGVNGLAKKEMLRSVFT